jgi:hypothetical protein
MDILVGVLMDITLNRHMDPYFLRARTAALAPPLTVEVT